MQSFKKSVIYLLLIIDLITNWNTLFFSSLIDLAPWWGQWKQEGKSLFSLTHVPYTPTYLSYLHNKVLRVDFLKKKITAYIHAFIRCLFILHNLNMVCSWFFSSLKYKLVLTRNKGKTNH